MSSNRNKLRLGYGQVRISEALWLGWNYVNFDLKQVTFPKTENGEPRSVPLHPRVLEALTELKHRHGEVFLTQHGMPYARPKNPDDPRSVPCKTAFKAACRRAGITNFSPHCCRHTWATWHYQANRDLTALQKLGGWKSVAMVMHYAHTNVSEHAVSIEKLPWGKSGREQNEAEEKIA